jgi:two-component system, chemotaxis family, chemotaxis protein CheY
MKFDGKVLVVDDEEHVRKFLGLILRQTLPNVVVSEAANGEEAVARYQQDRPSLVLMDVNMPIRDGISALREICTLNPDAVVVMMTSLANRQTVEETMQLGATYYFRKDTPRAEMCTVIKEIVSQNFEEN